MGVFVYVDLFAATSCLLVDCCGWCVLVGVVVVLIWWLFVGCYFDCDFVCLDLLPLGLFTG